MQMTMLRKALVPVVLMGGLLVSGCSNCSSDPRNVGLGCAIANHEGGVNTREERSLNAEIAASEDRQRELTLQSKRLEIEASDLRGSERRNRLQLARLNTDTAAASRKLASLRSTQNRTEAQIAAVRAREARLSAKVIELSNKDNPTARELAALQAEERQLNAAIERLSSHG